MNIDSEKILKTLNPRKVWVPVLLGIGFVVAMILTDEDFTTDKLSRITHASSLMIVLAVLVILCRDAGYVYRIRELTGKKLNWLSSIYVIILWEFSSAVTPSVVGGTAVAVFILYKEGLKLGSALAYAMLSAILDNMFFVIAAPIAILTTTGDVFPEIRAAEFQLGTSLEALFYVSYSLITVYTIFMSFALLAKPRAIKWLLIKITSFGFLRRWRHGAINRGNEIIMASRQLKGKKTSYWVKIALATLFIWVARYIMLNCIIGSYESISLQEHLLIFARQIVMWITMLISPTPGSSGTAELFFPQFFREFLGDYTLVGNIVWRGVSYYPYLLLGAVFLPRWLQRVFVKKKHSKDEKV